MVNIGLGRQVFNEEFYQIGRRMDGKESSKENLPFMKGGLAFKWFINA